jgi:hypothetical protein
MRRKIKILVLWLLLLALPVQAMASVVCLSCRTHPHQSLPVKIAVTTPTDTMTAMHHHSHDVMKGDAKRHASLDNPNKFDVLTPVCSACVACGANLSLLPSEMQAMVSVRPAFVGGALTPPAFSSHIPPGLERPPRILPA